LRRSSLIILFFLCAVLPASGLGFSETVSGERSVFKGSVNDVSGGAAVGSNIFIYNSPDVRRPADFIAHTGKDGRFRIALPSGKFWAVARLKRSYGYGPLLSGDKHSGEPMEITLASGAELEVEFIIKDLSDAASSRRKTREDIIKIEGRIIDIDGRPVNMAYAIANRNEKVAVNPDYLSSWTDAEGHFVLYLPRGKYHLGYAFKFPPGQDYVKVKEMFFEADMSGLDIVSNSAGFK
jgi:hypothetical protein